MREESPSRHQPLPSFSSYSRRRPPSSSPSPPTSDPFGGSPPHPRREGRRSSTCAGLLTDPPSPVKLIIASHRRAPAASGRSSASACRAVPRAATTPSPFTAALSDSRHRSPAKACRASSCRVAAPATPRSPVGVDRRVSPPAAQGSAASTCRFVRRNAKVDCRRGPPLLSGRRHLQRRAPLHRLGCHQVAALFTRCLSLGSPDGINQLLHTGPVQIREPYRAHCSSDTK
ncbi:unnamed protein product [Linum trigynum]|uniref:Uncharacterized protein n=1 Tax=Linum trigynum TaxID=586398 RepID=A0AAV2GPM6_9ROSI